MFVEDSKLIPDVSVCQVESNLPGEDRYCIRVTEEIYTYGVYDGHGGYLAADIACATLQDMIIAEISSIPLQERSNLKISSIIDATFTACDERIISEALILHKASTESSLKPRTISVTEQSIKSSVRDAKSSESVILTESALLQKQNWPKIMGRAGSCAVVIIITGGILFVAHVG
jgi:serine/threonine protein phosphatase PrpC